MHILITGGTGFIGSALVPRLQRQDGQVSVLSRGPERSEAGINYLQQLDALEEVDAVFNLAGASIAGRRWSRAYKEEIRASRLDTTRALVDWMAAQRQPPAVLVNASAIGYYGGQGDAELDENADSVPGFAQRLCAEWEQEALRAADAGVRVCLARLGVVLDSGGGAMQQMAAPFRFGVANWMGHGRQWLSWIHREDAVAALLFLLHNKQLSGPFNLTAPGAVTSRGFCDAMKRQRRTFITAPVPAAVMRLMLGEMAEELLLSGQRVVPAALQTAGFEFRYPQLDQALDAIV